ncbi:MAG: hypothetical protein IPK10_12230 [Bacteroidetes bacterium]|nr:hypothetical protein [Bacteroidota bacterium]
MKLITILAALTVSMLVCFSAKGQVIDTTYNKMLLKEINKQNSKISSGMLMGGFCIATGSVVSIISNNKSEPNLADYTDVKLYESDLDDFIKRQKTSRTVSSIFIGVGGVALFFTGMKIARIKIKKDSQKTVGAVINENGFGLVYNFD